MTGGHARNRTGAVGTRRAGGSAVALVCAVILIGAVNGLQVAAGDQVRGGLTVAWLVSLLLAAAGGTAMRRWRREVAEDGTLAAAGVVAGYEDQLHEVRAAVAGVATAVHVLTSPEAELSGVRRTRIEGMLEHEVHRLQRLLLPSAAPTYTVVALDDVIEPLVMARRLAGEYVCWRASGREAVAVRDHVAEVLTTLLENAACHAPGSPVWVDVSGDDEVVRVQVSDEGPGVPLALRDAIFERGRSRPGSTGQGIGLHVARALIDDLGGSLELAPATDQGATFVITLPAAEVASTRLRVVA